MSDHTKNAGVFAHELMSTGTVFGDGVQVRIGGESAYTDHKIIQLPGFDMTAEVSQSTARAMRGYVDHEAAHIDVTPPDMMQRAFDAGEEPLKRMVNAIEDLRIEKLRFRKYPGAKKNIEATLEATAGATVGRMMLGEASDVRDTDYGLSLLGRLRSGYNSPKAQQSYDMLHEDAKALCEEFVDEAMACETPEQVEELAARVLARVGTGHKEDEDQDDGEQPDVKRAQVGAEGDDGDDGDGGNSDSDSDDEGVPESAEQGDEEGERGQSEQEVRGWGADGEAQVPDEWRPKEAIAMPEDAPIAVVTEQQRDGVNVNMSWDRHVVLETPRDWYNSPSPSARSHGSYLRKDVSGGKRRWGRSKRKLRKLAGPMLGRVQAALMTETESVWRGGYKAGRLDQRRLVQAATGSETVWRQREDGRDLDNAVMLLVDLSGSMCGDPLELAAQAALTLAMVCEKAGVPACVMGFDAHDSTGKWNWQGREPNNTYVFKQFDTPVEKAWAGLTLLPNFSLSCNADADAIIKAEHMLDQRQEQTKTLIVLSDGYPAVHGVDSDHYNTFMRDTVARLERRADFNVFGIGIGSESVEEFYSAYEVLHDIDELPRAVTDKLCRSLLNKPLALKRAA